MAINSPGMEVGNPCFTRANDELRAVREQVMKLLMREAGIVWLSAPAMSK